MINATNAALTSIVLIVAITAWSLYGGASTPDTTLGGNAIATVPASAAPAMPLTVSLVANSGTLPQGSSVTLAPTTLRSRLPDGGIAVFQAVAFELAGSEPAASASFTIGHAVTSDGIVRNPVPLVASESPDGRWYTLISVEQLRAIATQHGPGWYVVHAQAETADGASAHERFALFVTES